MSSTEKATRQVSLTAFLKPKKSSELFNVFPVNSTSTKKATRAPAKTTRKLKTQEKENNVKAEELEVSSSSELQVTSVNDTSKATTTSTAIKGMNLESYVWLKRLPADSTTQECLSADILCDKSIGRVEPVLNSSTVSASDQGDDPPANNSSVSDTNLSPEAPALFVTPNNVDNTCEIVRVETSPSCEQTLSQSMNDSSTSTTDAAPESLAEAAKALTKSVAKKHRDAEERRQQREAEREKGRLEKQQQKLIREQELETKRKEKERQREAERFEKQRLKEEKQKQKEEAQAAKLAEIQAKQEKKEEERRQKEEEKRAKEEAQLREQEEKAKKMNAQKTAFLSFFKPAKTEKPIIITSSAPSDTWYKPYIIQPNVRLAPANRRDKLSDTSAFDDFLNGKCESSPEYLSEIKNRKTRTSSDTWPCTEEDADVFIPKAHVKVKLLQFHTDVRPAYFGTWRKKSMKVKPRRPLGLDAEQDYEYDSADEWEEDGEIGESVDSDEEEEEKDSHDFDPELREEGFLVDHNYLSDDEAGVSDPEDESLAAKKTRQIVSRTYGKKNRRKSKLRASVYGTMWQDEDEGQVDQAHIDFLKQFAAIIFAPVPITFEAVAKPASLENSEKKPAGNIQPVSEKAMPYLMKYVHGTSNSISSIIIDFKTYWAELCANTDDLGDETGKISKTQLRLTIRRIAVNEKRASYHKTCWFVHQADLEKYNLTNLPVPNARHSASLTSPAPNARHSASHTSPASLQPDANITSRSATPVAGLTPVMEKQQSSQKRMTEFVATAPACKKPKMSTTPQLPKPGPSSSPTSDVVSTDMFKSEVMPDDQQVSAPNLQSHALPEIITLDDSHVTTPVSRKRNITSHDISNSQPESSVQFDPPAKRRIQLTTLSQANKPSAQPAADAMEAENKPGNDAPKPRRIALITFGSAAKNQPF